MERVCEFCTSLRPVVYCKADEAYLCLSCDAKVHLANALSSRHIRTLLCNLCRYHLAYAQCLDHQILICRGCDQKLHDHSLKHQKRAIRSYMGCPSAKDFAALWGFKLNEIENNAHSDKSASISYGSADLNVAHVLRQPGVQTGGPSIVSRSKFEGGSSSQQGQKLYKDQERQAILQQIIDLKRLQLSEESNHSPNVTGQQETDLSPSMYHAQKKYDKKCDQRAQNPQDFTTNLPEKESPMAELDLENLSSTFSHLDNLPSSPIIDLSSHSEFWTYRSPLQSNQLWSDNIQDLGTCEELISQDDFNIPDVDVTFQNFEELFGGDQEPVRGLLGDNDFSCSSMEKDLLLDNSDIYNESTIEDSSEAVSITISQSAHGDKDIDPPNRYDPISMDPPQTIRPSHSTLSFFVSRFNAESTLTGHHESGLSTHCEGEGNSRNFPKLEVANLGTRGNVSLDYKEKKSPMHEKQARLQSRKHGANVRKRVKGSIAKAESS